MINDYYKMNKLNIVITSVLLVVYSLLQIIHVVYAELIIKQYFVIHPIRERVFFQVNNIFSVLMILIVLVFIYNIIIVAIGNKRKLILFHYGKSYYMKYLLTITAAFSTILLVILSINNYISSYNFYASNIREYEIENITDSVFQPAIHMVYNITLVAAFIAIVFTCLYLVDIFENCNGRYKSLKARNFNVIKFLIRYGIIWLCGFSLYFCLVMFQENYKNGYTELVQLPGIDVSNYLVLIIIIVTITLVIDYYCFLKKKVLM